METFLDFEQILYISINFFEKSLLILVRCKDTYILLALWVLSI